MAFFSISNDYIFVEMKSCFEIVTGDFLSCEKCLKIKTGTDVNLKKVKPIIIQYIFLLLTTSKELFDKQRITGSGNLFVSIPVCMVAESLKYT